MRTDETRKDITGNDVELRRAQCQGWIAFIHRLSRVHSLSHETFGFRWKFPLHSTCMYGVGQAVYIYIMTLNTCFFAS